MTVHGRIVRGQSPMSGVGLPLGAGIGVVVGVLIGGGPAIAVGLSLGACVGVVIDAVVVAHNR
jgi:hypothetical protein